jgi:uncharacterized phage protein (TIGR02218 family)
MKTIPAQMQADLDGRATKHCYCWRLDLKNGTTLGFTDHDRDLVFDSVTYKALTGMDASAISNSRNLNVDDMDVIGRLDDTSIKDSDIAAGVYDGAMVTIYKVDWRDVTNRIILMRGPLGKVSRGQIAYKAQIKSLTAYADQRLGSVYSPKCRWTLGEGICGLGVNLNTSAYRDTGLVVSAVLSRRVFQTQSPGALAREKDFYMNGKVVWTSGDNNTYEMWVRYNKITSAEAHFELFEPMPNDIQVGDVFTAYAGCQKTIEICHAKFSNVANFGGFPRIPGSDFILNHASSAGNNDGGSLYQF